MVDKNLITTQLYLVMGHRHSYSLSHVYVSSLPLPPALPPLDTYTPLCRVKSHALRHAGLGLSWTVHSRVVEK